MSQESFTIAFSVPNAAAGTAMVLRAPNSADAGGITVTDVEYFNGHAAGTVPLTLLKYDSTGTPALNGTVASTGGTVVADAPLVWAIGPNNYLQAGESAKLIWTGGGTPAVDSSLILHYKMGRADV